MIGLSGLGSLLQPPRIEQPSALSGLEALSALSAGLSQANIPNFNPNFGQFQSAQNLGGMGSYMGSLQGVPPPRQNQLQQQQSLNTISRVFVKNIPFGWDERRLRDKFRSAGSIEFAEIKSRDGRPNGFAVVKFYSPSDAEKAVGKSTNINKF